MDKKQKKQIKKYIFLGLGAVVVLLLALLPVIAANNEAAEGPQASILSAEAAYMDIDTQLIGGGQLSSQAAIKVGLPVDVKITSYLVGNGDTVKKGDVIATVDKVSAMTAITEIQETLDYLDEEINAVSAEQTYQTISSTISGTVKQVFATKGDNVQNVMLEHGALATISLDGLMAVDFESDSDLSVGDKLTVRFADGSEAEGRVNYFIGGSATLTIEDDDYAPGESVELFDENTVSVGSSELYIYSCWNVTAYSGNVSSVSISVGDSVYSGRTLLTLSDTGRDASYQNLIDQRKDYEEMMQELFVMYSTGTITSPCDGIITGVDEGASFILEQKGLAASFLSAFTGKQDIKASNLSGTQSHGKFIFLSNVEGEAPDEEPIIPPEDEPVPPPEDEPLPPPSVSYAMYPAKIVDLAEGSAKIMQTPYSHTVTDLEKLPQVTINEADLTEERLYFSELFTPTDFAIDDKVLIVVDVDGNVLKVEKAQVGGGFPGGDNANGGMPTGGADFVAGGMGSGYSVPVFEPYSLEKNVIASVTSQEQMTLSFTVDELDITKVFVGQKLTVTVAAIAGERFDGTISSISNLGENSGGNSKFTVEATLPVSGEMLPGMTAYAFITLDTAANALCIPVAALELIDGEVSVYTAYNEKKECLENPVVVKTGVADADYVQILDGLSEGSIVYYAYYE